MIKVFRLIAFILRIIIFYSESLKSLMNYFLFPSLIDSQQILRENEFTYSNLARPFFSENYFSVLNKKFFQNFV